MIIIGVQNYEFSPTRQTFLPDFLQINGRFEDFRGFQRILEDFEDFEDTLKLFFLASIVDIEKSDSACPHCIAAGYELLTLLV